MSRRVHYSGRPITTIRAPRRHPVSDKPNGLWYSLGTAWLDWCRWNQPEWATQATHLTLLDLDTTRILRIGTADAFDAFTRRYGTRAMGFPAIDWPRVAAAHAGIEIWPYLWSRRQTWYNSWDCASGCLWDPSCVRQLLTHRRAFARRKDANGHRSPDRDPHTSLADW